MEIFSRAAAMYPFLSEEPPLQPQSSRWAALSSTLLDLIFSHLSVRSAYCSSLTCRNWYVFLLSKGNRSHRRSKVIAQFAKALSGEPRILCPPSRWKRYFKYYQIAVDGERLAYGRGDEIHYLNGRTGMMERIRVTDNEMVRYHPIIFAKMTENWVVMLRRSSTDAHLVMFDRQTRLELIERSFPLNVPSFIFTYDETLQTLVCYLRQSHELLLVDLRVKAQESPTCLKFMNCPHVPRQLAALNGRVYSIFTDQIHNSLCSLDVTNKREKWKILAKGLKTPTHLTVGSNDRIVTISTEQNQAYLTLLGRDVSTDQMKEIVAEKIEGPAQKIAIKIVEDRIIMRTASFIDIRDLSRGGLLNRINTKTCGSIEHSLKEAPVFFVIWPLACVALTHRLEVWNLAEPSEGVFCTLQTKAMVTAMYGTMNPPTFITQARDEAVVTWGDGFKGCRTYKEESMAKFSFKKQTDEKENKKPGGVFAKIKHFFGL